MHTRVDELTKTAIDFARSLTDSVLPVPAGPAGDPPRWNVRAWVSVMKHRSVSGVMTAEDN